MRGGTVQINWHDTRPVLACDFHPISGLLATGGADFDIKLWATISGVEQKKGPGVTYQTSLSYHSSAVNALRFSPSGEQLASGADGGDLILWKLHTTDSGEIWKVLKTLSYHRKDVLDLQWSSDGEYLISGSVDNSCIIWNINKGSTHQIFDSHLHYVQGVAWDPLGKYAASLSSDRTCRIYFNKPSKTKGVEKRNYTCQHIISRAEPQTTDESKSTRSHLFHDETLPSFFRRLAWSPDGTFLLVPAGYHKIMPTSESVNTAYVFSRKDLTRPALMLPGASKPVVAVRFCPLKFSLQGSSSSSFFKLPYRLIFAVATLNSLYVYDTESIQPIAIVAGIHYSAITDIAWSPAGNYLALSSQDGYCTLLEFENQELGLPLSSSEKQVTGDSNETPVLGATNDDMHCIPMDMETGMEDSQKENAGDKDEKRASESTSMPSDMETGMEDSQKENAGDKDEERASESTSMHSDPINTEKDSDEDKNGKRDSHNNSQTLNTNKAAGKRRITPMAID